VGAGGNAAVGSHALGSLLLINLLAGCATGILQMAIPLYALSLRATTVELGLIAGVGGVGRLLVVLPSGFLIDRYGARTIFLRSTLFSILAVLALFWGDTPATLMAVMFVQGMGQSVSFMALQAGFLKRLPFLEPGRSGWQRGATHIGFYLFGPVLGGFLLRESRFGGAFAAVSAILTAGLVVSFYRQRRGVREIHESAPPSGEGELQRLIALLGNRFLVQVLVIECLGAACFMIFRAFVAPVAVGIHQMPVRAVSCLIICQGVTAMAVLLGGGGLLKRFPVRRLFVASGILTATGTTLLATAGQFAQFLGGAVVFGLGTGLMSLASLSLLSLVEGEKGKIAALFSFSIAVGNSVGPVVAGVVGDVATPQAAFLTPVPAIILSWLLFAPEKKRVDRHLGVEATE